MKECEPNETFNNNNNKDDLLIDFPMQNKNATHSLINPLIEINPNDFEIKIEDIMEKQKKYFATKQMKSKDSSLLFFDKLILSILGKEKYKSKEQFLIFYLFLQKNNYSELFKQKPVLLKFLHKYFKACVRTKIFHEDEVITYILIYYIRILQVLTKSNENEYDINILIQKKVTMDFSVPSDLLSYFKTLIKYIIALLNLVFFTKNSKYYNLHVIIINFFCYEKIPLLSKYIMKQLHKAFYQKGIYSCGNKLKYHLCEILINDFKNISNNEEKSRCDIILYALLYPIEKYYDESKIQIDKIENANYIFFNLMKLKEAFNTIYIEENLKEKILDYCVEIVVKPIFHLKLDLFTGLNELKLASYFLVDSTNDRNIKDRFNYYFFNVIDSYCKQYFNELEKTDDYKNIYYDFLFFDLVLKKIINFNEMGFILPNKSINKEVQKSNFLEYINSIGIRNKYPLFRKIFIDFCHRTIINPPTHKNTEDDDQSEKEYYIIENIYEKYKDINDLIDETKNINSLSVLYILLNFCYIIIRSNFSENLIKETFKKGKEIVRLLLNKIFTKNNFNCEFFDFLIKAHVNFLPDDFEIFKENQKLLKSSRDQFIITFPLYVIFILNLAQKIKLDVEKFFQFITVYVEGYYKNVFDIIINQKNSNNVSIFNNKLHLNYLNLIYFLWEEIIYTHKKLQEQDEFELPQYSARKSFHLPYCNYCFKTNKNPVILSNYLSLCKYCGNTNLYINIVLFEFLSKKNDLEKYINEDINVGITEITVKLLMAFKQKFSENQYIKTIYSYPEIYKMLSMHFNCLNKLNIIGLKKIEFKPNSNAIINSAKGILEENIKSFFDNCVKKKSDYKVNELKAILELFIKGQFNSFNKARKTIKYEQELLDNMYIFDD